MCVPRVALEQAQTDIIFGIFDSDQSGYIEEKEGLAIAHYMDSTNKEGFWKNFLAMCDTDGT